jgi:hypothetical protein
MLAKQRLERDPTCKVDFGETPTDISEPVSGILIGNAALNGELYECGEGGTHGLGGIYSLTPPAHGGAWTKTVLSNFGDQPADRAPTRTRNAA